MVGKILLIFEQSNKDEIFKDLYDKIEELLISDDEIVTCGIDFYSNPEILTVEESLPIIIKYHLEQILRYLKNNVDMKDKYGQIY
jgi:hypothetical protein